MQGHAPPAYHSEPGVGIEPTVSPLPRVCFTTKLSRHFGGRVYQLSYPGTSARARIRTWVDLSVVGFTDQCDCPLRHPSSEPRVGFGPTTCCLQNSYSTTELPRRVMNYNRKEASFRRNDPALGSGQTFLKNSRWVSWSPILRKAALSALPKYYSVRRV